MHVALGAWPVILPRAAASVERYANIRSYE